MLLSELISAIAILIGAVFVGVINLYSARTARLVALKEMAKAIAPMEAKIDAQSQIVAKIDGHVNSEKTRASGELATKDAQIALQREMIDELKRVAALLAQAKATTEMSTAIAQAATLGVTGVQRDQSVSAPAVVEHLEEIAQNTETTADAATSALAAVVKKVK